jgi:hypothetical protein
MFDGILVDGYLGKALRINNRINLINHKSISFTVVVIWVDT